MYRFAKKVKPQTDPIEKQRRAGTTALEAEILVLSEVETDQMVLARHFVGRV